MTEEQLDLQLAQVYFGLELASNIERTRTSVLATGRPAIGARHTLRAARNHGQGGATQRPGLARRGRARIGASAERQENRPGAAAAPAAPRRHRPSPARLLFVITNALKPLPEWLSLPSTRTSILAAFDAKREQAQQGIVIAESRWKPEVFAFGSDALIKPLSDADRAQLDRRHRRQLHLFSREDRASKVSAAREGLRQVQTLEAETRNVIDTAVETSYRKVEQAREQFNLLDSTLALARENLRQRERGFDEGQATSLDVNDARNALARPRLARAVAAYDFVVALAQLLEASGRARALPEYVQLADIQLRP